MKGNSKKSQQRAFLYEGLDETLNPKHPLFLLAGKVPWEDFENAFSAKYVNHGRPGKPIRLMTGLLILKHMFNVSDERLVGLWVENPYWQYFTGETEFQWNFPCDPSEMTYFRKRIGKKGVKKIFGVSVIINGNKAKESEVIADTTAQEKNIAYPTDINLHMKVARWVWKIAKVEKITLRQTYTQKLDKYQWLTRYIKTPKRKKEGLKAAKKIKVRAGRLLRDLCRKLDAAALERHSEKIERSKKILGQKRTDKNKIYSFHEPETSCIAKGKAHKKYEFGSKVSILLTKNSSVITGCMTFRGNPYDGKTLEPQLEQYNKLFGKYPKKVLVDEGYRGRKEIYGTQVLRVHMKSIPGMSRWQKKQRFRRRSAVEAVIGHLKSDHRMGRNFLKGFQGDEINSLLACAGFNFRKALRELYSFWQNFIAALWRFIAPEHGNFVFLR